MKAKGSGGVVLNAAPVASFDHKRDAYGFAVRPQHLQRYREYASIYKEEEEERSDRWKDFLERQCEDAQLAGNGDNNVVKSNVESTNSTCEDNKEEPFLKETNKVHQIQIWTEIRPSLHAVEDMMSSRVKKKLSSIKNQPNFSERNQLPTIEEGKHGKGASEDDSEEEFYDLERSESDPNIQDVLSTDDNNNLDYVTHQESLPPLKEEMECLVQGGVPMALRGEMWQAFVGVRARRVEKYYLNLLAPDDNLLEHSNPESVGVPEKLKAQIEKTVEML